MKWNEVHHMLDAEMFVLQEMWVHGTHSTRTHLVRNCFDLVNTENGFKTPEAVADCAWEDLSDELKSDLCSQFL